MWMLQNNCQHSAIHVDMTINDINLWIKMYNLCTIYIKQICENFISTTNFVIIDPKQI